MEPIQFKCSCCGEIINGVPEPCYGSPDPYQGVPAEEREARTHLDSDFCIIDNEEFFIRAVCPLPIIGSDEAYSWGIWVSLSEPNFRRYAEAYDDLDQSKLGDMFGWFCNRLPHYPDTTVLKTHVFPQDDKMRPKVYVDSEHYNHPLYIEQQNGITRDRIAEIYAQTLCKPVDTPVEPSIVSRTLRKIGFGRRGS